MISESEVRPVIVTYHTEIQLCGGYSTDDWLKDVGAAIYAVTKDRNLEVEVDAAFTLLDRDPDEKINLSWEEMEDLYKRSVESQ